MTASPRDSRQPERPWRLISDRPADGAANMARDESLLDAVERGAPPALRLYGWVRPTLSLGAHQSAEDADLAACRRLGVDLVRRPTGGGAVLHHYELTYAVAGRLGEGPFPIGVVALYERIARALVAALAAIGVDAAASRSLKSGRSPAHCFGAPSSREIQVRGRKLIGSAQVRRRGSFLQHGSILVDLDEGLLGEVLPAARRPHTERTLPGVEPAPLRVAPDGAPPAAPWAVNAASSGRPADLGPTTLRESMGRSPSREEIEKCIVAGFASAFEIRLEPSSYDPSEQEEAARLRAFKYLDACWTLEGRKRSAWADSD